MEFGFEEYVKNNMIKEDNFDVQGKLKRRRSLLFDQEPCIKKNAHFCSICEEPKFDVYPLKQCGHEFCKHCLKRWYNIQIQLKKNSIRCPCFGCGYSLSYIDIQQWDEDYILQEPFNEILPIFKIGL